MNEERRNIFRVAGIYAASITGAGFASGQEILQFFSIYRAGGFYGILLAGILFSVLGCTVLTRVYRERIRNYEEFITARLRLADRLAQRQPRRFSSSACTA